MMVCARGSCGGKGKGLSSASLPSEGARPSEGAGHADAGQHVLPHERPRAPLLHVRARPPGLQRRPVRPWMPRAPLAMGVWRVPCRLPKEAWCAVGIVVLCVCARARTWTNMYHAPHKGKRAKDNRFSLGPLYPANLRGNCIIIIIIQIFPETSLKSRASNPFQSLSPSSWFEVGGGRIQPRRAPGPTFRTTAWNSWRSAMTGLSRCAPRPVLAHGSFSCISHSGADVTTIDSVPLLVFGCTI